VPIVLVLLDDDDAATTDMSSFQSVETAAQGGGHELLVACSRAPAHGGPAGRVVRRPQMGLQQPR
jgi:hypothetical protein